MNILYRSLGVIAMLALSMYSMSASGQDDRDYRWVRIQGPDSIGHYKPVGIGMAGNGQWITTRAYLQGDSQKTLMGNSEKGSRLFGDAESVKTFDDLNLYYTTVAEIDNAGNIYAFFNQASVSRVREGNVNASHLDTYIGTKHLGTGSESYNMSRAKDIGVNDDGILWRIGAYNSPGGFVIERYTRDDKWERISGGAVKIDVGPDGNPWVVNDIGLIYHWDGSVWHQIGGKASDIAVGSDGTVWIVSAEDKSKGRPSRLIAWQKGSSEAAWASYTQFPEDFQAVNIAAGADGQALLCDNRGRLWRAVIDLREPELDLAAATAALEVDKMRDIAAQGPLTVTTNQRERRNIALTDGGAVSVWFLAGGEQTGATGDLVVIDEQTRNLLKGELGDIDLEGELGLTLGTTKPGCLLTHRSVRRVRFSLCLSADFSELEMTFGSDVFTAPIDGIAGIPQHLFLSVAPEGEDQELTARLWLNGRALGPWLLGKSVQVDPQERTDVLIGALDQGTKVFAGKLGTVRIWADAPDAAAVNEFPFVHQTAPPALPGYRDLVLEASLLPGSNQITMTDPSLSPPRLWTHRSVDVFVPIPGQYTATQLESRGQLAKVQNVTVDFAIPDVYRVRVNEPKSKGLAPTLTIFKDGESGVAEVTYQQTGRNTYTGIVSPVTGNTGKFATAIGLEKVEQAFNGRKRTVELMTLEIGGDRLYAVPDYPEPGIDRGSFKKLADVIADARRTQVSAEKVAVSDSFAFENMARSVEYNYHGHNVTQMSPLPGGASSSSNGTEKPYQGKIFHMFDPTDETSREYTVQVPVVIPWGTNYFSIQKGAVHETENVATTTREFQESFGFSLGASIGIPEVASFSNNTSFEKTVQAMREEKRTAIYSNANYTFYALVADRAHLALDAKFILAINDLSSGKLGFQAFFDTYGTHFANAVAYGQRARFHTLISEEAMKEEISKQWETKSDASATIKGVAFGISTGYKKSNGNSLANQKKFRETVSIVEGGTLSNSSEEMTLGDNQSTVVPVAFDLRPIWQLLSPLYFDDPAIYRDLRSDMQKELFEYAMANVDETVLSDERFLPVVRRVQLNKLMPTGNGSDRPMYGKVEVLVKQGNTLLERKTLWEKAVSEAVVTDPSVTAKAPYFDLSTAYFDYSGTEAALAHVRFEILADLQFTGSSETSKPQSVEYWAWQFTDQGDFQPITVGKPCTCFTECPTGYTGAGASCLKDCPANFEARGGNTCYGSYDMNFDKPNRGDMYLAWDMEVCEQEWGKGNCEHLPELLGTVATKCEKNFFRIKGWAQYSTFGICLADCEAHGLNKWAGGNATCRRPTYDRASQDMIPGTLSCPAGHERSNILCPHIALDYKLLRLN